MARAIVGYSVTPMDKSVLYCLRGILLASVSCVKTTGSTTPYSSPTAHQDSGSRVKVFYSPPSGRKYVELGLVTTQTGQTIFHDRSANGMIRKLQDQAARMGADAIIVRTANEGTWGLQGGGNTGFTRGNSQAVAIKYQ